MRGNLEEAHENHLLTCDWLTRIGSEKEYLALLGEEGYSHLFHLLLTTTNKVDAILQIASFLRLTGLPDHAIRCFELYLSYQPNTTAVHLYLQTLMFSSPEKYSHAYLYQRHVLWGNKLKTRESYYTYANQLSYKRKLRIGYTCHFITNSTSRTLLLPILKNHSKAIEVYMYSDQPPEEVSDDIRKYVHRWHDSFGMNDDQFCEQVRKDKIDILLELNGHCLINRYRALTRKPAPVQINYYNYSSTCGVPGIDYILVGEENRIDELQPYFSEKIFHKKGMELGTPISDYFPSVSPLPCLENGYITFGSFGEAHKVSREQIHLWCKVLQAVPNSKFMMKAHALDDRTKRAVYLKHFIDGGIDATRVILEGPSDYQTLLAAYAKIDIALDTYPFGAGTTTIEAAIQGVPTVSLDGERMCSKHGYVNLYAIGHKELVAYTKNEFISKAVELANDITRLKYYRKELRNDYRRSPRADINRFILELEDAYRTMWKDYVKKQRLRERLPSKVIRKIAEWLA